jgi:hypothetical protein
MAGSWLVSAAALALLGEAVKAGLGKWFRVSRPTEPTAVRDAAGRTSLVPCPVPRQRRRPP